MLAFASRGLALALALTFASPALATPAGKDGHRKETSAEALRKALDFGITLELTDTPLPNVIQQLGEMAKVTIVMDRNVIFMAADPAELLVTLKAKDMKLRTALRTVAGQHGLTFAIVGDHILVSTEEIVNYRQLRQRVQIDLEAVTLPKALKDLAQQTATNILIDPRSMKNADAAKVTLQLEDVPLETAVRLMSEMAGLKPVRMGNVLFITSEDRADKLKVDGDGVPPPGVREMVNGGGLVTPGPALPPPPMALPPGGPAPAPAVPPMPMKVE